MILCRFLAVAPQEGLKARKPTSCAATAAWLEDRE